MARYTIATDKWNRLSNLNVPRSSAAGCTLGNSVFVFAGSRETTLLNSVERLDVTKIGASWELINIPEDVFAPRQCDTVVPLNETVIAILGGKARECLSDVLAFDINKKTCRNITNDGGFKFQTSGDSQAMVIGSEVIALVQNVFVPSLISWTIGQDKATVLDTYKK